MQPLLREEELKERVETLAALDSFWAPFSLTFWAFLEDCFLPCLHYIPPSARDFAHRCFLLLLTRLLHSPSCAVAPVILRLFPRLIFAQLPSTHGPSDPTVPRHMRQLCITFLRGDWPGLRQLLLPLAAPPSSSSSHSPHTPVADEELQEYRRSRCHRSIRQGRLSRALQALSDPPPAPPSPSTLSALQAKHPPGPSVPECCPWLPSFSVDCPLDITPEMVQRALSTLPRDSSGAPSSWLSEHLQYICLHTPPRTGSAHSLGPPHP